MELAEEVDVDDSMEIDETISNTSPIIERTLTSTSKTQAEPQADKQKPVDVVILDDDEMEPEEVKAQQKSPPVPEIIDLVDKKPKVNRCLNPDCKNENKNDYISAPDFCLSYFRVKRSKVIKEEICPDCYLKSIKDFDRLSMALIEGKPILSVDFPVINETLRIDDSDEEAEENEETEFINEENFEFIRDNIDEILIETVERYELKKQYDKENEFVLGKMDNIDDELTRLTQQTDGIRKLLDGMQIELYNVLRPIQKMQPSISIMDDSAAIENMFILKEMPTLPTRKSKRQVKPVSYVEVDEKSSNSVKPAESQDQQVEIINRATKLIPDKGTVNRPLPQVSDLFYITRESAVGPWIRARVQRIIHANQTISGVLYKNECYKLVELKQQKERIVTGKNMAYITAYPVRLPCGARVISSFHLNRQTPITKNDPFYAGVVAEEPTASNNHRYLIFFDIGYAQYSDLSNIHLILDASKNVWEDVPPDARTFIQKYFESPDRPMVKLNKAQFVKVEYNGKWHGCRVTDIDCSLVQVKYEVLDRNEWIYRGSSRLSPLYKEEQAARLRNTRKSLEPPPQEQNEKNKNICPLPQKSNVRAVARKTTSRTQINVESGCRRFLPTINKSNQNNQIVQHNQNIAGPTSKIMYFSPRDQSITSRKYAKHQCSISCKAFLIHSLIKLRGHNPLSKPLVCGWTRLAIRSRNKKEIQYKAPCGRRVRNIEEVHQYLRQTESEMTVDLFDFNHLIRCLAEFCVECPADPKDLSRGVEQVPIPVVNGINNDALEFCNYSIKRVPMEGVHMNLDPEFLCGCDCTDDCSDKTKCACWKLTLEGLKYSGKDVDPDTYGYIYRRLPEQVITGIYECNSRCKCAKTCLNRVVQNPMSLKLQVFKTHNRGWGIRCLNDVPQGSFLCIYAGTMNTEQKANIDGMTYGDEYFAELDYIEAVESFKEGYEEEAYEDEEDREKTPPRVEEPEKPAKREYKKRYLDDNIYVPPIHITTNENTSSYKTRLRSRNDDKDDSRTGVKEQPKGQRKEGNKTNVKEVPKALVKAKDERKIVDIVKNPIDTVTISDDEDEGREVLSFNPKDLDDNSNNKYPSVRELFGKDEAVYVMDAKNIGNIGRFLNHCCQPNVFVQNVFVDTHDARFPWVAFFSSQFIRAGSELTWNYNYDVGSVPGRRLWCHCGAFGCKGRLL